MNLTPEDLDALFKPAAIPTQARKPGGILDMLHVRKPAPPPTLWQQVKSYLRGAQ